MRHGPMAGYADVISKEDLCKILGDSSKEIVDILMKRFGELASGEIFNDDMLGELLDEGSASDLNLWNDYRRVQDAFIQMFIDKIYLQSIPTIHLCHHSDEEGCYDEVKGLYWRLDKIYVKTEACKKIEETIGHEINRAFMVTYG